MNAFKMTAVAAALIVAGLATQNAQAQVGYYSPYNNYTTSNYSTIQCGPNGCSVPQNYSTGYSTGLYSTPYVANNWNNYPANTYGGYNAYNRGFNNLSYNNQLRQEERRIENQVERDLSNRYSPYYNTNSIVSRPYYGGTSTWTVPQTNWLY